MDIDPALVERLSGDLDARNKLPKYGLRPDGTKKGNGWLGKMKMTDGSNQDMTEYSITDGLGGKDILMPSVVPTLSRDEVNYLLGGGKVTPEITNKAIEHAKERMRQGLSPFKD